MYFINLFLALILCSCGEPASSAVSKLIAKLKSPEVHERNKAAHKLGDYGRDAESAVKPLISLLSDPNNGVRSSATYSLRRIGNGFGQGST